MRNSYLKFVQWNEPDQVHVGYCPDLFIGGVCHGRDEAKVYAELCRLVAEELAERRRTRQRLPKPRALVAMTVAA
jgi:hypothetical protein